MITTISDTWNMLVLEQAKYQYAHGNFDITIVCSPDEAFAASLPPYLHYAPIPITRGFGLSMGKSILALYRLFKKERFALIHYITINASFCASNAGKLAGVPVRIYSEWGLRFQGFTGLMRRVMIWIEKTIARCSTFISTDSRDSLDICRGMGIYPAVKSDVMWNGSPNGVSFQKFDVSKKAAWRGEKRAELGIPEDMFAFGYVGRNTRDKGVTELFRAARQLFHQHDDIVLVVIGPEVIAEPIDEGLFEWSKNEPRVFYTGFTTEVEKYMSMLDMSVLPSYREGFGNVIIESEALEIPVVASDISGVRCAMKDGETGLLIPAHDADALAHAVERLYADASMRARMGRGGAAFVHGSFDQQILYQKKLELKERLLGQRA